MSKLHVSSPPFSGLWRMLFCAIAIFATSGLAVFAADTARVTGTVVSKSTGNALQGAQVTVAGRSAFTDESGRFTIFDVPVGNAQVTASYSGFKDITQEAAVSSSGLADFTLTLETADVLTLAPFTVQSVKEGQALSVTEQRNAGNIKTVVSLDEWGVLPTQNVGELAARLPGVTFTTDEDDLIFNISIRGQPDSYTRLNIDGMSATGVSGVGRTATLHSFSASNYEAIEIVAAQTPDKRADSLGGQVNLRTRSPLAMKEKRRITYNFNGRYFPSWSKRNVPLSDHPLHPDLSVGYTEIFDVFGGKRNLGIAINASYQEVVNQIDYDFLQYQNIADPVAYFHDYDKRSGINHRFIQGFSARADYRVTDNTTASLTFIYNAGYEPYYDRVRVNPFGTRTIYNGSTGLVLPGYTANRTEIRQAAGTRFDVETWNFSFVSKNPTGTLRFEHDWDRLKVDHAYRWSMTRWHSGHGLDGQGGQYVSRLNAPLGFILDNSDLDGKVFTQTGGPSVWDINSYTPILLTNANTTTIPVPQTSRSFVQRDTVTKTNEVTGTINAQYQFDTKYPLSLKVGLDSQNRRVNSYQVSPRRWYGVIGSVLNTDLMPLSEFEVQNGTGGQRVAAFKPSAVSNTLSNSALWYEDVNFNATAPYIGRRILEEGVDSAYIQADARFGKLRLVGGVRNESVKTETFTYFRARSTLISDQPDHYKRAAMDYNANILDGKYSKSFPSVHFTYDITPNLKLRGGWAKTYGRPLLAQMIPGVTANDATQSVTIGNPSLLPQLGEGYDLKLDYYFKNSGKLTAGVFKKTITDYIGSARTVDLTVPSGPDNGFDGLYGGYIISQSINLGDAKIEGIEIDYSQRLSMLPGALKGLTISANYTYQRTEGNFGGTTPLNTDQVAGFVPRLFNARVLYNYKKFGASFDANFKGAYLVAYSTTAGASRFQADLLRYNVGFSWRYRPEATFFLNFDNITEEGPEQYFYTPSRISQRLIAPTAIKFGVTGTF
ncbi:MAG: TonB-dependent receptor [Opitutae bacterium]|nr:TonB-dependent receptor [Opitutae bacterium]